MILALTSDTMTQGQMYDAASTDHRAEAVAGRGRRPGQRRRQLAAGGARRSSIRSALNKYGIGFEDVRAALAAANANRPKGAVEDGDAALADRRQRPGEDAPPTTCR